MEDNQIIKLFEKRSEEAITQLSQKYGSLCKKMANNFLNNKEDVEESVNDAYLAIWNSIPPNKPDSIRNYLCKIMRNLSVSKFHYNTADKRNSQFDLALDEFADDLYSFSDLYDNNLVENVISFKELGIHLNDFLAELDKDNRIIFVLRYWYGDSVNDIAKKFKLNPNTISAKLKRTREKLKSYLELKGVNL